MTTCGRFLAASLLLVMLSVQSASAVNESSFVEVAKSSIGEAPGGQSAASASGTLQGNFPSGTTNESSFVEWAINAGFGEVPGGQSPASAFGALQGSFNPGIFNIVGMAYDQFENGLWIADESTGSLHLISLTGAPIRSINLLAFGLTGDGFADGVAVDGNRLLVTDFQGDLVLHDDIIMDINRTTGALNNFWNVDGAQNPNPNANMNTVLGIAKGAGGTFWVSTADGQIHNVNLMAGGQWSRNSVGPVPGGGVAAEIDYDSCLNQYFIANWGLGQHQHHNLPNTAMLASFPGSAPNQTAITSNNAGVVWVSGFGDNIVYRHEGIPCAAVFGTLQGSFPSGTVNVVGMAYDQFENGLWIANESGTGTINLITLAGAPIRSINILAYGLTGDGNQDGVAVVGNRLLVTDFQGDLNLHDDIIMDINRTTGALNGFWNVDGPLNPNPNANLNTILGIAPGAGGTWWVSTNDGQIHNINLLAAGQWSRNSVIAVPGGGSAAEIDYDECLNQFFMTNFGALNRHQYHNVPNTAILQQFPGSAPNQTCITSDHQGTVFVSGFGDNVIYRHIGIPCNTTSVAGSAPAQISLIPMTPNPFSGSTRLEFNVAGSHSDTNVGVYDTQGRLVRTLVRGVLPAGAHAVVWDGRDQAGQALPSGQYFYDLRLQGKVLGSGKVLLVK